MADKPWWPSTITPLPQGMEDYLAQSGMDDAGKDGLRQHLQGVVKDNPLWNNDQTLWYRGGLAKQSASPSGEVPVGTQWGGMVKEGPNMGEGHETADNPLGVPPPGSIGETIGNILEEYDDVKKRGGNVKPEDETEISQWIDLELGDGATKKLRELINKNKTMKPDELEKLPEMQKIWKDRKKSEAMAAQIKEGKEDWAENGPEANKSRWHKLPPLTDEQRRKLFATGQPAYPPGATPEQMLGYPWKK